MVSGFQNTDQADEAFLASFNTSNIDFDMVDAYSASGLCNDNKAIPAPGMENVPAHGTLPARNGCYCDMFWLLWTAFLSCGFSGFPLSLDFPTGLIPQNSDLTEPVEYLVCILHFYPAMGIKSFLYAC